MSDSTHPNGKPNPDNAQTDKPAQREGVKVRPLSDLYEQWFLEYASYVILERAVPDLADGLKPVQRRILHAMREMHDGRYHKVANIIGQTMQYHPHGDAAIGDALVGLGQKDLLIDTQGNWGDIRTGDSAAAPRYIEARLTPFALEVAFNPQTTEWQASYDGRKKEPVSLPMKFPLVLAQGAEGIAVGLATKILPHNFCELIEASIAHLKGKKFNLLPDFPTGGMADCENYNEGLRGGRIRLRAQIEEVDKKYLAIREIPFGTTTTSLIDSILKANDQGKLKVKKVVDNTAQDVEILIELPSGISPSVTIDALYAFTDCEVSISPNCCVISHGRPEFLSVNEMLKRTVERTQDLLEQELRIRQGELKEKILFGSLEKIFIEERIYRRIEECETWAEVISTIDKGLEPFKAQFYRTITEEDILRLTEIKIKRISKFDAFQADERMRKLSEELAEVEHHLENLVDYTIAYYQSLLDRYGKGKERKTILRSFETIQVQAVAQANQKLYVNRADGFVGTGLKKDEYIGDCSDLDEIIVIREDGVAIVSKVADKTFFGKGILHAGVFQRGDDRLVFNLAYRDGKSGTSYVKRFNMGGVTRDKEYVVASDAKGSKVLHLTANQNGEAETIEVRLSSSSSARNKVFEFDFADLDVKGRGSKGNILTKYPVRSIKLLSEGVSTLGGLSLWYDGTVGRVNREERGQYLGELDGEDKLFVLMKDGTYRLTGFDPTTVRFDPTKLLWIGKFDPELVLAAIHQDKTSKVSYLKRFQIETQTPDKDFLFIPEESRLVFATAQMGAKLQVVTRKAAKGPKTIDEVLVDDFIDIKGWKAQGNKLSDLPVIEVEVLEVAEKPAQAVKPGAEPRPSAPAAREEGARDAASPPTAPTSTSTDEEGLDPGTEIELEVKRPKDDGDKSSQLGMF